MLRGKRCIKSDKINLEGHIGGNGELKVYLGEDIIIKTNIPN